MLRGIIACIAAVAFSAPAMAQTQPSDQPTWNGPALDTQGWFVGGVGADNNTVLLLKPFPHSRKSTVRKIWARYEFAKVDTSGAFATLSYVDVDEVKCIDRELRIIQETDYTNNNFGGEPSRNLYTPNAQWSFPIPGSLGDTIATLACT